MTEPRRRTLRIAIQLAGFAIGIALLAWAISIAFKEENRAQLERLGDATIAQVTLLFGLSALTIGINGLIFWVVLEPVRRLRALDVVATSAIAHFMAYLPFKLSVIVRAAIHNRRDGVPLLTIGAWVLAISVSMGAALGPPMVASIVRPEVDLWWMLISFAGVAGAGVAIVAIGRYFGFERGLSRLHRVLDPITPRRLRHLLRGDRFQELHDGFTMLSCPRAVTMGIVLRLADVLVQAFRFQIAADVLGVELTASESVLFALSYFIIGVVSPSGMLGVREMGTAAVASLTVAASDQFVGVTLLVTGTEAIVALSGAAAGVAWLGPHKLFRSQPVTAPHRGESA